MEYRIKCPSSNYKLPNEVSIEGFESEVSNKDRFCKEVNAYKADLEKKGNAVFLARIKKANGSCVLDIAFPTYTKGMSFTVNRNDEMYESDNFRTHKKAAELFANSLKLELSKTFKVIEGQFEDQGITYWCSL